MNSELKLNKEQGKSIVQYDISIIPNDFNITTIFNLIDSGAIEMPMFQRNYVWDKKCASRFVESLILGLPIPQIFLYQKYINNFFVIDGQQRLLSIYYFIKQRFPLTEKRAELRKIFDDKNCIPNEVLNDDNYFQDFKLNFAKMESGIENPLQGLKYSTLGRYKSSFEFMTIRCMVIRQNEPKEDDSSVFEIFSRLNTGGVNLNNQEIRACLYYSDFFRMLNKLNENKIWRKLYGKAEDKKFKDVEIILRSFALLCNGRNYKGTMNTFINKFAKEAMEFSKEKNIYLFNLFESFMMACKDIPRETFITNKGNDINASLFDSIFAVMAGECYHKHELISFVINPVNINSLKEDSSFKESITHSTSHSTSVHTRLNKAREYLLHTM